MRIRSVAVFILFLLSVQQGFSQTDTLADVFPLAVGNAWTYRYLTWSNLSDDEGSSYRSDSGTAEFLIKSVKEFPDSSMWLFSMKRDLLEKIDSGDFGSPRGTSSTTIHDSSLFFLIEQLGGRHQLIIEGATNFDVFPYFRCCDTAFRYESVGPSGTASWLWHNGWSDTIFGGWSYTQAVVLQKGIGELSNRYDYSNSQGVNFNWGADHYLLGSSITAVQPDHDRGLTNTFTLSQNYPNPFNPTTTIQFAVARQEYVSLKVFNMLGEEVADLVGSEIAAGFHKAVWQASAVPSGVYFYRIRAGSFTDTKRLLLLK